jgi:MFS family permease
VGLAGVEGAIIFGGITFLPAAVEAAGSTEAVAGLALAAFGAGSVVWTRLLGRATRRMGAPALILLGAGLAAAGYAVAAAEPALAGVVVAAFLVAGGYGFMHTTLQTWATGLLPGLRASVVALFAAGLFCGGAVGAELLAPLADRGDWGALFGLLAVAAVPLGAVAALARGAWRSS